jgi:hypothetical protein
VLKPAQQEVYKLIAHGIFIDFKVCICVYMCVCVCVCVCVYVYMCVYACICEVVVPVQSIGLYFNSILFEVYTLLKRLTLFLSFRIILGTLY